ncbi:YceI family protein [Streptacidiphilus sp. EB129]|uniref:YceI family protein n=1 Tax=Streptacidiphilus sp. EB129 TaxID=3156262 RepID=UPI0035114349
MSASPTADAASALKALPAGHYVLDPSRSSVRIQHKTMWGLVTVKGGFTGLTGTAEIPADDSPASGSLTVDTATLDTAHTKRDEHLRSADFFHIQQHPTLVFTAQEAVPTADGGVKVTGSLTVRGVTEPLSLTATAAEVTADSVSLTAETTVDRASFGLGWNKMGMLKGLTGVTVKATFTLQK